MKEWKDIPFEMKCSLLGQKGEDYFLEKLKKKYPENRYIILDLHDFLEMDFIVVDKGSKKIIEIYEVKTTTTDKKEFSAGSILQLLAFEHQKIKDKKNSKGIPSFLHVIRTDRNFWKDGILKVNSEETYSFDKVEIDLKNLKWTIKGKLSGPLNGTLSGTLNEGLF